jgi:hypothetical protein
LLWHSILITREWNFARKHGEFHSVISANSLNSVLQSKMLS